MPGRLLPGILQVDLKITTHDIVDYLISYGIMITYQPESEIVMEQYLESQMNIQKAHFQRINVAICRVAIAIIAILCLGLATLGYVFDHEQSVGFYAMFLTVLVAMVGCVIKALAQYNAEALEADAIRDRDLRVLKHARQQFSNSVFA